MDNFDLRKFLYDNILLREDLDLDKNKLLKVDDREVDEGSLIIGGIDTSAGMDDGTSEAFIEQARFVDGTELTKDEIEKLEEENPYLASEMAMEDWGQY